MIDGIFSCVRKSPAIATPHDAAVEEHDSNTNDDDDLGSILDTVGPVETEEESEDAFSNMKRYKVSKVALNGIRKSGLKKLENFAAKRKEKLQLILHEQKIIDEAVASFGVFKILTVSTNWNNESKCWPHSVV